MTNITLKPLTAFIIKDPLKSPIAWGTPLPRETLLSLIISEDIVKANASMPTIRKIYQRFSPARANRALEYLLAYSMKRVYNETAIPDAKPVNIA